MRLRDGEGGPHDRPRAYYLDGATVATADDGLRRLDDALAAECRRLARIAPQPWRTRFRELARQLDPAAA